jgi:hypothetical protein
MTFEWKLADFCVTHQVNQSVLANLLYQEKWSKTKPNALLAQINSQAHSFDTFARRRDWLRFYRMYRSYLNASAMELTGCKSDEEAVAAILQAKLQRQLKGQKFNIEVINLEVAELEPITIMPAEIVNQIVGTGYKLNGGNNDATN